MILSPVGGQVEKGGPTQQDMEKESSSEFICYVSRKTARSSWLQQVVL